MSIIQSHTSASLTDHWRTIDIDALDPESSRNFPIATLAAPPSGPRALDAQSVRGLLRGGDAEGALRGAVGSGVDKVRLFDSWGMGDGRGIGGVQGVEREMGANG
jgi:actin related protein 2/3 complex subunit 5